MRILMLLALSLTACLRTTEFKCSASSQCGAEGVCESTGFCSVPDDQCGRRYTSSAGSLAGQCVGGGGVDGGIDGPSNIDAATDAPAGCPSGYNPLSGAPHKYKLVTQNSTWDSAAAACAATAPTAYLAIPDDANELAALTTLAAGSAPYWVGVDDKVTEGTWLNTKNAPQTFLPWAPGHPITSPANNKNDCVRVATNQFTDEACNNQHPAICECE